MKDIAIILGIRPDVIRASKILNILEKQNKISYDFIWSGQHYSENMKDTTNSRNREKQGGRSLSRPLGLMLKSFKHRTQGM